MPGHRCVHAALVLVLLALASASAAHAQCGPRYVAPPPLGNGDAGNTCLNAAVPCNGIGHAVAMACAGDTVLLAEGAYTEDVVVDKAVRFDSSGANAATILRGSGAADILAVRAAGVTVNGLRFEGAAGHACVRVGDAAHPGVRKFELGNSEFAGCGVAIALDSVGKTGDWLRLSGNVIGASVADGSPTGGTGVLVTGGGGRIEVKGNTLRDHGGAGLLVEEGGNGTIVVVGNQFLRNGRAPGAGSKAGLEVHAAGELRVEGNEFAGHDGPSAHALLIEGAGLAGTLDLDSARLICNNVHGNAGGLRIEGAFHALDVLHDRFAGNTGPALDVAPGAAAGIHVHETVFEGNGAALANADTVPVDARHCWWGAADGPAGAGGSGDPVSGPVDVTGFVARTARPALARGPSDVGWSWPVAACHDTLQGALDEAPDGGLVLVGAGTLRGQAVLTRPVDIEGLPPAIAGECPPAWIDGTQSGGHVPALRLAGVDGITLRHLTIANAGLGVPCDVHSGDEIGLDLENVRNSRFESLCLRANGVTEVRLRGDSDDNVFDGLYLEGMIQDNHGHDVCEHRSREGILVDGGPACEGGAGALAERNRILRTKTYHVSHSIKLRLTRGTEIAESLVHGLPCDEWGPDGIGVTIEMSDDTWLHDNVEIGNRGMKEAIRILGRSLGSCATEELDSSGTRIERTTVSMVENAGIGLRLYRRAGDPGAPVGTRVSGSTFRGALTGILAEHVGGAVVELSDIVEDTAGVRNLTTETLPVRRSFWGDPSGPSGEGPGSGTSVHGPVDWTGALASSARDDADGDGFTELAGDADDTDPLLKPFDGCDAFDNDQDGATDEDFAPAATACGVGACAATGTTSCTAGRVEDSCTPGAPAPSDATCDAVDDDCDGSVDEEYPGGATACGTGACARSGELLCAGGTAEDTCHEGTPAADDALCNGTDDDCDGPVDEEFARQPTACGVGVCRAAGGTTCVDGVPGDDCVPGPPASPADTLCNLLDDDCDGPVDEDYAPRTVTCGVGVCERHRTTTCSAGVEDDSCVPGPPNYPADASCNGLDDDCDGAIDDEFVPHPDSCGQGICVAVGEVTCTEGVPHSSCVPGTPGIESCNGLDDDCDGTVDDVAAPAGAPQLTLTARPEGTRLAWPGVAAATVYDVVGGSLAALRASGGDFATATDRCLADDVDALEVTDGASPDPGQGFWYLVRAANCGGAATYDDGAGLVGSRDPGIAGAAAACP